MEGTEKNLEGKDASLTSPRRPAGRRKAGPVFVIILLLLGFLGCALTWWRYTNEHPSTANARLAGPSEVDATFEPPPKVLIEEGMKAIISVDGHRSPRLTGRVIRQQLTTSKEALLVTVRLLRPVEEAEVGWPCQVTIDTTIPPHLLTDATDE